MCAHVQFAPLVWTSFWKKNKQKTDKVVTWKTRNNNHAMDTLYKKMTQSCLQNVNQCTSNPRNHKFDPWILLVVSQCKIMDTVCHPLHLALTLFKNIKGYRTEVNMQGIRANLVFSLASFTFSVTWASKVSQHFPRPPCHTFQTPNSCLLFSRFLSHHDVLMITQKWMLSWRIILSGLKSLFFLLVLSYFSIKMYNVHLNFQSFFFGTKVCIMHK